MISLTIPQAFWNLEGPEEFPEAKLRVVVNINGCDMHLEAIAIIEQSTEDMPRGLVQVAAHEEYEEKLSALFEAGGGDGYLETIEIDGLKYVLLATPFCT